MTTTDPAPPIRYSDRFTDDAKGAWRAACRRAGLTNAWTTTPSPASSALLATLAELTEPLGGTALAARAGVSQGKATSTQLPRLAAMGLATWRLGDSTHPGAPFPRLWTITERGREMARILAEGAR